ncbi:MAG: hypothetical protein ACQES4_05070 [Bacillota bacterium]
MDLYFLLLIIALFILNLGLIAWSVTDLLQREKVKYLPKVVWLGIVALIFFGGALYLLVGRDKTSEMVEVKQL